MSSKKGQKSSSGTRPLNLALGHRSPILPVNCEDQKVRFLRDGKLPEFVLRGSYDEVKRLNSQDKAVVRFDHLEEAERILNLVRKNYGDSKAFLDVMYGPEINKQKAAKAVSNYIHNNNLEGHMTVNWCPDLACSATMMWQGPALKYNRPEARRFSLWICDSKANTFLREQGITSLLHHEIGTHYFRMHNDGLQPWFSDRKRFHLQGISSRKLGVTEEGLASIHTVLDSNSKFLWTGALLYYAACKAEQMSFRELFDHLERYVEDKEQRWKHCLRVKRGQENVNVPGGYGKDQCYFEGAVKLLKNIDKIDFVVLMAGKICYDEVNRCKRLARTDIIKLPHFMNNAEKYKRTLREIAKVNCLTPDDIPRPMGREKPSHRPSTNAKTSSHQSTQEIRVPQKPESPKPFESDGHLSARSAHSDASAKTPQFFRYTHTPTNSASLASRDSTTRADSRLTNTEDKLCLAENQEELFGSSQSVRASSPYRPKTARTRSVCATDVVEVPEIKHYSERLLHRKSVEGFKASHKRKKKRRRKKATHREPEPAPTAENTSSEEDVHRFGCLRSKSRNEEKEDMSEL